MPESCPLKSLQKPCPACPWRLDATAHDIPNFDLTMAEDLAATCPDERGMGPDFGASIFARHQSKVGSELACAGWLAQVGHRHPGVRLAIAFGRLDPAALKPQRKWPALHENYASLLENLRLNCQRSETSP